MLVILSVVFSVTCGVCQEINYAANVKTEITEDQMLITYDAVAVDGIPFYDVTLIITYNGEKVQTNSMYGDLGGRIAPGTEKSGVWYYKNDFRSDIQKVIVTVFAHKPLEAPVSEQTEPVKPKNPLVKSFCTRGGANLSKLSVENKNSSVNENFQMNPGFQFGITAEFPVNSTLSFEPGLLFSTKGAKKHKEDFNVKFSEKRVLNYLEIPVNVRVYLYQGNPVVFGLVGPYLGYGLTGRINYEVVREGVTQTKTTDVKWGSDVAVNDYKRLDFGLSAGVGVEANPFRFGLSYGLGLANISPDSGSGEKIHNMVFGFFTCVEFGGKKE